MLLRPLTLLALTGLLAACAGEPAAPRQPTTKPAPATTAEAVPAPLPAHLRELSGSLLGIPLGAEVELALLVIDPRGLPQDPLATAQLRGDGAPLSFRLAFDPQAFPLGRRVELRGRVHLAGRLILRLPPQPIHQATSQALGVLQLVPAP